MIDSAVMAPVWISRTAVVTACLALLASCGGSGSGEDESARDAAQAYVQARNQGDAGKICELYSDQLIQTMGASNCQGFVKEHTAGTATAFTLVGVQESGDQATATIRATAAGETPGGGHVRITLQRQGGEWKITALGNSGPE